MVRALRSLVFSALVVGGSALAAPVGADPFDEAPPVEPAAKPGPTAVVVTKDLPYAATTSRHQRLDLYLPKVPSSEKLPVVVFFHGGGWYSGDKSAAARHLNGVVQSGRYAGVSINYRLSTLAIWPAQLRDAKAAIRWIRAHSAEHGLDPDRILVWGRSAGAHLALMVGLTGGVAELEGKVGVNLGESSRVQGVINSFGVTDLPALVGQPLGVDYAGDPSPTSRLLGGPMAAKRREAVEASPLSWVSGDDPPVFTVHGTADLAVPYDQALRLDRALRDQGVPSIFVTVPGGKHELGTPLIYERTLAFIDRTIGGLDVAVPGGVIAVDDADLPAADLVIGPQVPGPVVAERFVGLASHPSRARPLRRALKASGRPLEALLDLATGAEPRASGDPAPAEAVDEALRVWTAAVGEGARVLPVGIVGEAQIGAWAFLDPRDATVRVVVVHRGGPAGALRLSVPGYQTLSVTPLDGSAAGDVTNGEGVFRFKVADGSAAVLELRPDPAP